VLSVTAILQRDGPNMEKSLDGNGRLASQIYYLLWNHEVHYRVMSLPSAPIVSHLNLVHTSLRVIWIHVNNILPSTPRLRAVSVCQSLQPELCTVYLSYARYRPAHFIPLTSCEVEILWSLSLCSILQSHVTLSRLGPSILLNAMFSNAISMCSSLNARGQKPHLDRNTCEIIVFRWEIGRRKILN
jgi:hypothetical protein